MTKLRIPIFIKILLACGALASLLVGGSFAYTKHQIEQQGRGQYLRKHHIRYLEYQHAVGEALAVATEVVARNGALAEALIQHAKSGAEPVAVPQPTDGGERRDEDDGAEGKQKRTPAPPVTSGARAMHTLASAQLEFLRSGLGRLLRDKDPAIAEARKPSPVPDVFIVVDAHGVPVFIHTVADLRIDPKDVAGLEAVKNVIRGGGFAGEVIVHDDHAFQAAGVAVRSADEKVVGGVILGVLLERFFIGYRRQSDEVVIKQHRLTLVAGDKVLASTFGDTRPELFKALDKENKTKVKDGREVIEVIDFDGTAWDFWSAPIAGFTDQRRSEEVGTVYLMRTRTAVKQDQQMSSLIFAAGLGLVLSLVFASGLAFILTRPLRRFIDATREIAGGAGDLTKRIELSGNDEFTDLAANINQIFENLHHFAQEVSEASLHVSSVSAELCAVSRSMNDGAKGQSEKLDDAAARVYELSRSISEVATNASDATLAARQADEAVTSANTKMAQIRGTSEDASSRMRGLGESVQRIGNIVEVIQQISEQSSLLALNASIEAAHAGEQGRGFAVVADEVSSLARRVGQSAKDIEDRIGAIREQTAEAVRQIEAGSEEVEGGTRLVTSTLSNLKNIIEAVQQTALQVEEQAQVSDDVSKDVDEVKRFSTEVLGSSEQVLSEGDRLHRLAEQLTQSVHGFHTHGAVSLARPTTDNGHQERALASADVPALRESAVTETEP